jgi:hypothetical protein
MVAKATAAKLPAHHATTRSAFGTLMGAAYILPLATSAPHTPAAAAATLPPAAAAAAADVNYVLRFYRNSSAAWVRDAQGNNALLEKLPLTFGRISVIPINRVLMSGG